MTQKVERAYVEEISDESRLGVGEDSIEWLLRRLAAISSPMQALDSVSQELFAGCHIESLLDPVIVQNQLDQFVAD